MDVSTSAGFINKTSSLILTPSDYIQISIAIATFFAVIVALFRERYWKSKDRPKIKVYFD